MTDRAIPTDRVRQEVVDYLRGALEDSKVKAFEARLDRDPVYQQELQQARGDVVRLQGMRRELDPPPGLAERTIENVLNPARRLHAALRRRPMTPSPATPHSGSHWNWHDVGVVAVIFVIAGLLVLPAIHGMQFQARVAACQDNLRKIGQALAEYSRQNQDLFPVIPTEGNLAAAGIYAPILMQDGFLTESATVVCADSAQAQQKDFRVPTLADLRSASGQELFQLQQKMGGSYGYCLGYFDQDGAYQPTRNLHREYFAVMADAPSADRPGHQSANHGGLGQNVLFEDMHVEFCSTTCPGDGKDDIFTNDNHAVAPGRHVDDAVIASSGTAPMVYISLP